MVKGNTGIAAIALLLIIAVAACAANIAPTESYFSDTEPVKGHLSAGEWGCQPRIRCICPDWGVCGACSWAVFIHGDNLGKPEAVQLVRGSRIIRAKKAWFINSSCIYAVFDLRGAETGYYDVLVVMENGEAILEDGFQVVAWCCRAPLSSRSFPAGEDRLSLEKKVEGGKSHRVTMTVRGEMLEQVSSVCLVAPGYMQHGDILDRRKKKLSLAFDADTIPLEDFDLVLTTGDGWNLLLEKAITIKDLRPPVRILQLQPTKAPAGGVVEIRIKCAGLHDEIDFRLLKGNSEYAPIATKRLSDGKVICTFDLSGITPDIYDIVAVDRFGIAFVLPGCFTVYTEQTDVLDEYREDEGDAVENLLTDEDPPESEEPMETAPDGSCIIAPSRGSIGTSVDIVIRGGPFTNLMRARLTGTKAVAWAIECRFPSTTRMESNFNLNGIPAGEYMLEILDQRGARVYIAGIFEVI